MGSNDFATLVRGAGVEYAEVVLDVADKLGAKEASKGKTVEENEAAILGKLFADALDKMSDAERRQLFSTMGMKEKDIPFGSTGTILVQLLLKNFGGFATYRISLIVANMVARALLGSGLSFATNIAITRTVGVVLGPVGWVASAAWLLVDLAGPAYRVTVPAVVHVAMLRQMLMKRINIGVVGEGSTGKDSLVKAVFGVDTGNVNPVAGSTAGTKIYELGASGAVHLVNYPGFNDTRNHVNQHVEDMLPYTDVFLMVVDINRGVSGLEVTTLEKLKRTGRPILVCLNKADMPRPKDRELLMEAARERLQGVKLLETVFDPDPRLGIDVPLNCSVVHEWVVRQVALDGKETDHIPKSEHV
jgi:uncharacterized protein YaaW (UPF0174 family)/GTPase SAR1 family protein